MLHAVRISIPLFFSPCTHPHSVHRWLFDEPGILHRDLSFNNIMYRPVERKVYGPLTDYDLSSCAASLTTEYTKASQQRTGTPPYMTPVLLRGTCDTRLYRYRTPFLLHQVDDVLASYNYTPRGLVRRQNHGLSSDKGHSHIKIGSTNTTTTCSVPSRRHSSGRSRPLIYLHLQRFSCLAEGTSISLFGRLQGREEDAAGWQLYE